MIVEPTYQELQHPMRRHIRGLLGHGQQLPPSLLEQERRLEHRIRTSGLTDRLIHLLAGVQDSQTRANEPFEVFVMGEGSEALNASAKYADIITWLASSSQQYRESHFDATGRVADSIATLCTTRTDVKVEPDSVRWNIPSFDDWWKDFKIWVLEKTRWLPGGEDRLRSAKREATAVIRGRLSAEVLPQVQDLIDSTRARLVEANDQVARGLEQDMRKQFELTGGESTHLRTIADADGALSGPAVEPLLIALPVRTMRRLGWRQS